MSRWCRRIAAITLIAPGVFAATINTTGQFYYTVWTGANRINGDRSHFFDGPSPDARGAPTAGCNIGWYIEGFGSPCDNQPGGVERFIEPNYEGPGTQTDGLPWLGDTTTTNNLDLSFQPQSPTFTVRLMAEASPSQASNVLGVYTTDTLGNIVGTLVLFAGTDTPGKTVQFSPGNSNWGFFFATGAGSYYTERLLGSDATMQHFAIFRDAADVSTGLNFTKLWIGAEESPGAAGFPDYNDMIFTLTCNECGSTTGGELGYVPEPDTWITFGSGVVLVSAAMVLGRVRASRLQSATLRRGSDARNRPQECSSGCLCSDGGSSARLAAGIVQTSASVSDSVRQ